MGEPIDGELGVRLEGSRRRKALSQYGVAFFRCVGAS